MSRDGQVNSVLFKDRNDPRITSVGRFIRRYSLDELPQLLNVLAGQMSLVGPRPNLTREVALYESDAIQRLRVLPGMTGLVADQRSQQPELGGVPSAGPLVRRQLVADAGSADPHRDGARGAQGVRGVLSPKGPRPHQPRPGSPLGGTP